MRTNCAQRGEVNRDISWREKSNQMQLLLFCGQSA